MPGWDRALGPECSESSERAYPGAGASRAEDHCHSGFRVSDWLLVWRMGSDSAAYKAGSDKAKLRVYSLPCRAEVIPDPLAKIMRWKALAFTGKVTLRLSWGNASRHGPIDWASIAV